jgi:hypothetical protein
MSEDNIIVFFHIATIGNYQEVVDEMFIELTNSGLINVAKEINLCIVGDEPVKLPNFKNMVVHQSDNILFGEFYTLNKIKEFSNKTTNNHKVLYIHTKGVTVPNNMCIVDWRQYMMYFNVNKHTEAISLLNEYDTCGVDLVNEPTKHYSGNFWWSNTSFIKKLPFIDEISKPTSKAILTVRHNAEFWLFMCDGKNSSLHNSNINVYERHLHRYAKENYIN